MSHDVPTVLTLPLSRSRHMLLEKSRGAEWCISIFSHHPEDVIFDSGEGRLSFPSLSSTPEDTFLI